MDQALTGRFVVADVHGLTDEWMPGFGEMDPDLMRLAGLELDRAQRGGPQLLAGYDVSHRALPLVRSSCGATEAIATVRDEIRLDASGYYGAVGNAHVGAAHRVRPQLGGQPDLGALGLRKHE